MDLALNIQGHNCNQLPFAFTGMHLITEKSKPGFLSPMWLEFLIFNAKDNTILLAPGVQQWFWIGVDLCENQIKVHFKSRNCCCWFYFSTLYFGSLGKKKLKVKSGGGVGVVQGGKQSQNYDMLT